MLANSQDETHASYPRNRWTPKSTASPAGPLTARRSRDQPALLDWALAAAAAAEQRVADLEERLAYLEGLSVTDELTAVLNRRGFLLELTRAIAAAARGGPQGVLIVCDLDGFKAVNDLWATASATRCCARWRPACAARVRKNDVVGRLGGDEFALLLIGADPVHCAGANASISAAAQQRAAGDRRLADPAQRQLRPRRI